MQIKKYLAIFTVSFIIIYGLVKIPSISRAASDSDQIPSDLSLDLNLAQQNPAPAQRQIIQSQIPQAKIVTDKGEQAVVVVKDEVPAEVKLQSAKDAINPEQTTSEQVVNKTVESDQSQPSPVVSGSPSASNGNNPAPTPAGNVIPGTDILEPDDNGAPLPSSSVNPSPNSNQDQDKTKSAPSGTGSDNSVQSTSNPSQPDSGKPTSGSGTTPQTNPPSDEQSNTIPLENGSSASQPVTAPSQNSSSEDSNSSGSNNSSSGPESGGDTVVQGVSSQAGSSWLQILLNKVGSALGRKSI